MSRKNPPLDCINANDWMSQSVLPDEVAVRPVDVPGDNWFSSTIKRPFIELVGARFNRTLVEAGAVSVVTEFFTS